MPVLGDSSPPVPRVRRPPPRPAPRQRCWLLAAFFLLCLPLGMVLQPPARAATGQGSQVWSAGVSYAIHSLDCDRVDCQGTLGGAVLVDTGFTTTSRVRLVELTADPRTTLTGWTSGWVEAAAMPPDASLTTGTPPPQTNAAREMVLAPEALPARAPQRWVALMVHNTAARAFIPLALWDLGPSVGSSPTVAPTTTPAPTTTAGPSAGATTSPTSPPSSTTTSPNSGGGLSCGTAEVPCVVTLAPGAIPTPVVTVPPIDLGDVTVEALTDDQWQAILWGLGLLVLFTTAGFFTTMRRSGR